MPQSSKSPYLRALQEMKRKSPNLAKASGFLNEALERGDARAAYALGTWHLHGRYYKKNVKKAAQLLKQAAEAKLPDALYDLAVCYEKGVGVRKTLTHAFELYLKAALCGDKGSVYEVGRCLYYGIGIKRDKRIAEIWLEHFEQAKKKVKSHLRSFPSAFLGVLCGKKI